MFNRYAWIIDIVLFFIVPTFQAFGQFLIKDGKTDFIIVLSDSPQPLEQTAATELKTYLDKITNINWTISSENDVLETESQILIGNSSRAKNFFPEIDMETIPYDGIEIHLKNNKLLLTGHQQRGTLYAVNTFLEDVLGVRWWTSTEQKIPSYNTFELHPLNISYAPKLIYREAFYMDAFDPIFATQMKCNGFNQNIAPEYGGHHRFAYFVHSFFSLIPPEKYFGEHPEWFSEIDGERRHEHAQLCLANDEMRKELTKNAIDTLRKNPVAKFISISQNDCQGFCTCEKCSQIAEEEGAQSGLLIRFVNQVAEEIEKEFPDVFVETLAYQYTREPPKYAQPRQNVVVRLCTIECSFVHPLTDGENRSFYDDMHGWSKIAKQLFIWDYVTNFSSYMMPHPNLRVLAPNIRLFVEHGAIGLFEQGDAYCTAGDFVRMRNWVISHLMWNPALDEKKLTEEFLAGYYGNKAAPILLEYFDTLLNRAESTGEHIGCFMETTDNWLDYETLCKATALFDQAIDAAIRESGNDSEFVYRLRRERLPLEHVWLREYYKFERFAEAKGVRFVGPAEPMQACIDFFDMCEKYGVKAYREYDTPEDFDEFKVNTFFRFGSLPTMSSEFRNLAPDAWIDIQEYDFRTVNVKGWFSFIDDPAASNRRAVAMPGNHFEWAVSIPARTNHPLFKNADMNTKFKVIAYVRCDATAKDGSAMTLGIYDKKENVAVAERTTTVSEIAGSRYQKIEFESLPLTQSMYIWFAPPKREGEVQAVYIDRVLLIREK